MTIDLWTEASRDLEAEHAQLRLFEAQQRTADLWPFVALAQTDEELNHRIALIQDTLTARVPDISLHGALIEGLTANMHIQGYSADLDDDTGGAGEPETSSSGFATDGSSLQDQDGTPDVTASKHLQIWNVAQRRWAAAEETPGNPAYFSGGQELGPNTGNTGTYPVEVDGPDPWNPINGKLPLPPTNVIPPANRFPAQPQPWTVPPDKQWIEHPMNFGAGPSAAHSGLKTHAGYGQPMVGIEFPADGVMRTLHTAGTPQSPRDGFQPEQANPFYFSEGRTGLESEESAGFPIDQALPEPDERVDLYQHATPATGGAGDNHPGEFAGPAVNFTVPPQYVTSARNNGGACASCGRPVYRQGSKWHHLDEHLRGDHQVMLDANHPWVQQMAHSSAKAAEPRIRKVRGGYAVFTPGGERQTKAMLYSAALKVKQANQYIHQQSDGQWVITQKGTGKVLSHHDSKEMAEEAFSAMEMHKHEGSRLIFTADGSDPSAAAGMGMPSTGGSPMQTPAPPVPPSMTQGAAGAEAMPPMAKPPVGSGNPTTASRASLDPRVAVLFHVADEVRGRPTNENPGGVPDEFDANTWEGPLKTHPRQSPEQRGINTPQLPRSPIPQISSSDNPGANENSAQEDENDAEDAD